jgi:hypothetical protein
MIAVTIRDTFFLGQPEQMIVAIALVAGASGALVWPGPKSLYLLLLHVSEMGTPGNRLVSKVVEAE